MTPSEPTIPTPAPFDAARSVLVIGGGLAGFHVAHALRRRGFTGEITVLGAEPHPAYDRPPLSKAFLAGTVSAADLALDCADSPLDVTWVRGVAAATLLAPGGGPDVLTLDPRPGVRCSDGREWRADAVVLATGASPIRLGDALPGTHVLRTLDDAEALRADGIAGRAVIVVGFGFIGLEAAASACALGAASVDVVGVESAPLVGRFGPEVAAAMNALHERAGVRFHGDSRVAGMSVDESGRVSGVLLDGGRSVAGDLVIMGLGVRPATGWLGSPGHADSGVALEPSGAVTCDASGRTGLPGVFALGDCARWSDGAPPRAGHWQDALDQAAAVAASITGGVAPQAPEPYCWSDQHGVLLQVAGHLDGTETAVVRDGSVAGADLLVTYERDGIEVAILGMNRMREVTRWRRTRAKAAALTAA